MASEQNPATSHIRMMELRIERQVEAIERQKQAGEDTADAVRRLGLLRRALDEMRLQLGQLSPTDRDRKRPGTDKSSPPVTGCASINPC
jgi:hypothetical protein